MTVMYDLAVMGSPTDAHVEEMERSIAALIEPFSFRLGRDVGWSVRPAVFAPAQKTPSAFVYFGTPGATLTLEERQALKAHPVIPVLPGSGRVDSNLPPELRGLNALSYADVGPTRVASALLECVGLLHRQRRVFVSYRREEARAAALQLFEALSARLFDVFLDTHGVAPGDDFQTVLWHRLCDSDVLVMLDTATYLDRRWTKAELGRAFNKKIGVLRIGWPGVARSDRAALAVDAELLASEFDETAGTIIGPAVQRVVDKLELLRSESIAIRRLLLLSKITSGIESIGGKVLGTGIGNAVYFQLPDGRRLVAYPVVGVPTSLALHQAQLANPEARSVVVYDHIGVGEQWVEHLDWLGKHISIPRWLKADYTGWDLADWEDRP